MPRLVVTSDQTERRDAIVLLDEQLQTVHISSEHSAMQLIERLRWAVGDAENAVRTRARGGHTRSRPRPHPDRRHSVGVSR